MPIRFAVVLLLFSPRLFADARQLQLDAAAGTMVLKTTGLSTAVPGPWLDGEFQKDFEAVEAGRYRNASIDLVIETFSSTAVAAHGGGQQ